MKYGIFFLLFAMTSSFFFQGCQQTDEIPVPLSPADTIPHISVSTGLLSPTFDPSITEYHVTSLNILQTFEVSVEGVVDSTIFINGQQSTSLSSVRLHKGQDLVIQAKNHRGELLEYTIHYLPKDFPDTHVVYNTNTTNGYTFVNFPSTLEDLGYIAMLDEEGFPLYYKKEHPQARNLQYFELPNGTKRFTYNIRNDKVVVMNERFEVIDELRLLPHNGHEGYPPGSHDFMLLDEDHYLIQAYVTREDVDLTALGGQPSVDLVELVFQEIKDGQVIFEWNSADHPELLSATDDVYFARYATEPVVDYFHFNSFTIDPKDNHFIISARHMNQVYKIHRTTGEILWRLGGKTDEFQLDESQQISHIHHSTITPSGTMLIFDNGNTKSLQETRVIEFQLDEVNKTATTVWEYRGPGRYTSFMGSAQRLSNGHTLIGWGGNRTSQINANKSDFTEVDQNGNIVLDVSFTNQPNRNFFTYRAIRYTFDLMQ